MGLEHRVSFQGERGQLILTPGHQGKPIEQELDLFGHSYHAETQGAELNKCVACHTTAFEIRDQEIVNLHANVTCEKCHGPGREHVHVMNEGGDADDLKIEAIRGSETPKKQVKMCGECHRLPQDLHADELVRGNRQLARFQPAGMLQSSCHAASPNGLTCTTCHDPHSQPELQTSAEYEMRCLQCHQGPKQTRCAARRTTDCVSCHMPAVEVNPGMVFHDHWIRVRNDDDPSPELRRYPKQGEVQTLAQATPRDPTAVNEDWVHPLGAKRNTTVLETDLISDWPSTGPRLLWELHSGTGYALPAVRGRRLVFAHRLADDLVVDCRQAETGALVWQARLPTSYQDRVGYDDGPRCSPLIDGDHVYVYGADGQLTCLALVDGARVWQRSLPQETGAAPEPFGVGDSPIVIGALLIVKTGGSQSPMLTAMDKTTGKTRWQSEPGWSAGYAPLTVCEVNGRETLLAFTGGAGAPGGGLLAVDPEQGSLFSKHAFRSEQRLSLNAAAPVVDGDRVFLSASYGAGSALLKLTAGKDPTKLWTSDALGTQWSAALYYNGFLYGFDGESAVGSELVCLEVATGKQRWRERLSWTDKMTVQGHTQDVPFKSARGSLLRVGSRFLCRTETGHLLWLALSPEGPQVTSRAWLFKAQRAWVRMPPVLSHGLLYVRQTAVSVDGAPRRLLCFDLRKPRASNDGRNKQPAQLTPQTSTDE